MTRSLDLPCAAHFLSFEEEKKLRPQNVDPFWDVGGSCDTGAFGSPHGGKHASRGLVTTKVPPRPPTMHVRYRCSAAGQQYQVRAVSWGIAFIEIGPTSGEWRACKEEV